MSFTLNCKLLKPDMNEMECEFKKLTLGCNMIELLTLSVKLFELLPALALKRMFSLYLNLYHPP